MRLIPWTDAALCAATSKVLDDAAYIMACGSGSALGDAASDVHEHSSITAGLFHCAH
jgi:hypothetical protein